MTKDVIACIKERRTIRKYTSDIVNDATIGRILEAATLAPSGGNRQPWFFYVVKNNEVKEQLVEAAYGQSFLMSAPVVIVVCADPEESGEKYGDRGRNLYCIQDTAAATMNMILAAHAYGLGCGWIGAFSEERVVQVLNLPKNHRPVAIIPIGVPAEEPEMRPRKSLDDVVQVIE
jgi:nitroreductase